MKKILTILIIISFFSCRKDVGPQTNNNASVTEVFHDVLISCEGNFGTGNGSLSLYSSFSKEWVNNYFDQQNNFPLGDVVQSIAAIDQNLYIVVNNSGKIEVIDSASFLSQGVITGFTSPREMAKIDNDIAYVTDLYSNSIHVVDLNIKNIINNIAVSGWTEAILVQNNYAYVSCPGSSLIYKIDVTNHALVDSVATAYSPLDLVIDKNNSLWVVCSGNWGGNDGTLEKINLDTFTNELVIQLNSSPSELCINNDLSQLFWLANGVKELDVDQIATINSIIPSGMGYFYGLGIHPNSNDIYVTDAIDFVQAGKLYRYNNIGIILDSAVLGINPHSIFFK